MQYHMSGGVHIVTLLASMASRMEHLDKRSVQYSSSYFINRVPVAIRKCLTNMTAILTEHLEPIQSGIDLGGDYLAVRTHLLAARAMTNHLGGLDKLESMDSCLVKGLILCDLFMAIEVLRPPLIPCT
jgi:hypothetical protein